MTDTAIAPPVTETREYFWIMTVLFRGQVRSLRNVAAICQGTTRSQAFDDIRKSVAEQVGCEDFVINHFSLEPNEL